MKRQNIYRQVGRGWLLLALAFVIGWAQLGAIAAAQETDTSSDVITTVEPISPVVTPEPTDEPDSPVAPTSEVDVVITVEPVVSPEPMDEPEPTTEPLPTTESPDTNIIVDPPGKDEIGEPIKGENDVALDDRNDEEGQSIDIFDLTFVASRYGTDDPAADINLDGAVDIFDLTILASHYGQSTPPANAVIVTPTPLPEVEANGADFGVFDLSVEAEEFDAKVQSYVQYRSLRIGISLNYFKIYDATDSTSAPDPYMLVSVGNVPVRTHTTYNTQEAWPYWRLGWWRYTYFPWAPRSSSAASYYSLPLNIELRDDDGYVCYGYYGCRYQYQYLDISSSDYRYAKNLTLYPSSCMVVDEVGTRTYGYWLDNNRCRVYLQSWGTQWPRGYVSYYVDASWE